MEHEPQNEPMVSLMSVAKIEKLSQKAWEFSMKTNNYENQGIIFRNKFAELIIKECGKLLTQPEYIGRSDLDWSMILNEHFGVK